MPDHSPKFPTAYSQFIKHYRGKKAFPDNFFAQSQSYGNAAEALRFCNRYRLAASFKGLQLEEYKKPEQVAFAYEHLVRVLFTYSAYETLRKVFGISQEKGSKLSLQFDVEKNRIESLRKIDRNEAFFLKIYELIDSPKNKEMIKSFLDGKETSLANLGMVIRHAFAHGRLASVPSGNKAASVKNITSLISVHILELSDDIFSKKVETLSES